MGTELQSSSSFFNTLPGGHGNTVTISFDSPDTRASAKGRPPKEKTKARTASDILQQPRQRVQRHRESLRETMLEHEKIFKEQVQELHRLYRRQKLIMSQLKRRDIKLHPFAHTEPGAAVPPSSDLLSNGTGGPQASSSTSASNRHLYPRNAQLNDEHNLHPGHRAKADQEPNARSKGNSAATSDSSHHRPPSADVGDAAEDRGQKLNVESPSSCSDEDCDLDLTLSIGGGRSKKRRGCPSPSDTLPGCRMESSGNSTRHWAMTATARGNPGGHTAGLSADVNREELQQPPWLFQGLSLNRA